MTQPRLEDLILSLSGRRAASGSQNEIEVIQTHISVVFLAGDRVHKLKKPKKLGFLDFTTADRRRHYCHEEVRLNRRLAPGVYEGVVPVVRSDDGFRFGQEIQDDPTATPGDDVVDWAVRMVRLPEDRTLRALLRTGQLDRTVLGRLAAHIARFHEMAERSPKISESGGWVQVSRNARANFQEMLPFLGETISSSVFQRLKSLTSRALDEHRPLIERRALEGVPADTHGDLRLGHVYLLPEGTAGVADEGGSHRSEEGDAIVIVDCIEFNEAFRWADPVADVAFLFMELEFENHAELARAFAEQYFEAAGDSEGAALLDYYASYRDIVRGKVRSLESSDPDVSEGNKVAAAHKAMRHFLRALVRMADPSDRPGLVIVQGLPGVGKSTLARALADREGFTWIDTDRVRKELAESRTSAPHPDPATAPKGSEGTEFEGGLYSPDWTERTYLECLRRARTHLFDGGRVVVEGSFRREAHRRQFMDQALELGVPVVFLHAEVTMDEAQRRLAERAYDVSDANWHIHQKMAAHWEAFSPRVASRLRKISTVGPPSVVLARVRLELAKEGLTTVSPAYSSGMRLKG